jgi:hypothetical protein
VTSAGPVAGAASIRPFERGDLDAVVAVWTEAVAGSPSAVFPLSDVVSALAADHVALVAERDGALVGAVVANVHGDHAWSSASGRCPRRRVQG